MHMYLPYAHGYAIRTNVPLSTFKNMQLRTLFSMLTNTIPQACSSVRHFELTCIEISVINAHLLPFTSSSNSNHLRTCRTKSSSIPKYINQLIVEYLLHIAVRLQMTDQYSRERIPGQSRTSNVWYLTSQTPTHQT